MDPQRRWQPRASEAYDEDDDGELQSATTHHEKNTGGAFMLGAILPWLHGCLVVVLTGLLATLYTNRTAVVEGWLVAPTRCTLWVDGACVPKSAVIEAGSLEPLKGQVVEYESRSSGLFSEIHAPFLCLAVEITCFAMVLKGACAMQGFGENAVQVMKHLSLAVLSVYGALYLFMQSEWNLPVNNVLLVECTHVLGIFFVGTYSLHKSSSQEDARLHVWLVNVVLTYPLLAVAALSAAGEDGSVAHVAVFFGLTLACFALVAAALEEAQALLMLLTTFWLCLVPFVVHSCARLHAISYAGLTVAGWAAAALVLLVVLYLLLAVIATVGVQWSSWGLERATALQALEYFDFVVKATLSVLIMVGVASA
jgi:hypothetical protein